MPQIQVYAGTGDGRCYNSATPTWSTARDESGSVANTTSVNNYPGANLNGGNYIIRRVWMPFDTSAIPDDATIISATLRLSRYGITGNGNDFYIVWTNVTTFSATSYAKANWGLSDTAGHTEYAASFPMSEWSSNGTQVTKTLNLSDLTISKTGTTYLGAVDVADFNNSAPSGNNLIQIGSGDNTDDAYKPQLTVVYKIDVTVSASLETVASSQLTPTVTAQAKLDVTVSASIQSVSTSQLTPTVSIIYPTIQIFTNLRLESDINGQIYPIYSIGGYDYLHKYGTTPGDMQLDITDSAVWDVNVKYSSYSVNGDVLTLTKELATGYNLTTTITKKTETTFKIENTFDFDTNGTVRINKLLYANLGGASNIFFPIHQSRYGYSALRTFEAGGVYKSSTSIACIIAGQGYKNHWILSPMNDTEIPPNTRSAFVVYGAANAAGLEYGNLQQYPEDENEEIYAAYSIRVYAGTPKTIEYAISLGTDASQNGFQKTSYIGYYDAFCDTPRRDEFKLVWSITHQLMQYRNLLNDNDYMWAIASPKYAPRMYNWDANFMLMGLGDEEIATQLVRTMTNFGPTAEAWYLPNNSMNGTAPAISNNMYAYLKLTMDITPPQSVIDWARGLVNVYKTYFSGQTQDMTASAGNFEVGASYVYTGTNVIWTLASGATIVDSPDGGVSSYSGTKLLKMVNTTNAKMIPICAGQGLPLTVNAYVRVMSGFSGDGFRLKITEYGADKTTVVQTSYSTYINSTSGTNYSAKSVNFTTHANSYFVEITPETSGTGTIYCDYITCKEQTFSCIKFWDYTWSYDVDVRDCIDLHCEGILGAIVNVGSCKSILDDWSTSDQALLDELISAYKDTFILDNGTRIPFALNHPIRKTWRVTWALANEMYYYLYTGGEKIFTDEEFALLYENYPAIDAGLSYGMNILPQICLSDGSAIDRSFWAGNDPYAGGPVWYSSRLYEDGAVHTLAGYHGIAGAADDLANRLSIETHYHYSTYDYLALPSAHSIEGDGGQGFNVWIIANRPPVAPSNVVATGTLTGRLITWTNEDESATAFNIQRSIDGGTWEALATTGVVEQYEDTEVLNSASTIQYKVSVTNNVKDSIFTLSNIITQVTVFSTIQSSISSTISPAITAQRSVTTQISTIESYISSTLSPAITTQKNISVSVSIQSYSSSTNNVSIQTTRNVSISVAIFGRVLAQLTSTITARRNTTISATLQSYTQSQLTPSISVNSNYECLYPLNTVVCSQLQSSVYYNDNLDMAAPLLSCIFEQLPCTSGIQRNISISVGVQSIQSAQLVSIADGHHSWWIPEYMITQVGSIESGTFEAIQHLGTDILSLREVTGTPGFTYDFYFENVSNDEIGETKQLHIDGYYLGNVGHNVKWQQYNYTTSSWTNLTSATDDMNSTTSEQHYALPIFTTSDYINSNNMRFRVTHPSAGSSFHRLYLNYLHISEEIEVIISAEPESIYQSQLTSIVTINRNAEVLATIQSFASNDIGTTATTTKNKDISSSIQSISLSEFTPTITTTQAVTSNVTVNAQIQTISSTNQLVTVNTNSNYICSPLFPQMCFADELAPEVYTEDGENILSSTNQLVVNLIQPGIQTNKETQISAGVSLGVSNISPVITTTRNANTSIGILSAVFSLNTVKVNIIDVQITPSLISGLFETFQVSVKGSIVATVYDKRKPKVMVVTPVSKLGVKPSKPSLSISKRPPKIV